MGLGKTKNTGIYKVLGCVFRNYWGGYMQYRTIRSKKTGKRFRVPEVRIRGKAKMVGQTRDGKPICIKDGRIVVGEGCFEIGRAKEGGMEVVFRPDRCETDIKDALDRMVEEEIVNKQPGAKTYWIKERNVKKE